MNKNRTLFLDRDGVINVDTGYIGSIERFSFMPNVFPFLEEARNEGFRLAIVTNQAGVSRGHYTEEEYNRVTAHMLEQLKNAGILIDLTLACFYVDQGSVPPYGRGSFWRKPNPGMVLEATRRLKADPTRSAFIGDRLTDMEAAAKGGIAKRLWLTQETAAPPEGVRRIRNFTEALACLKEPFA